jgi:HAE1 family hydrophobic/amphiphilic exporter-1
MEALAKEVLPVGFSYSWSGLSLEEIKSGSQSLTLFGLGLLVVYLTLAAQYESFVLPFIILLGVPMALLGALGAQALRGLDNDVYCQIGLVMLIGLSSKNGILIVEFANELQRGGKTKLEAVREATLTRLRPVLMTSVATVCGHFPLTMVTGAGAAARNSIGIVVVSGMALGTIFTLLVIPAIYVLIAKQHASQDVGVVGDDFEPQEVKPTEELQPVK